MKKTIAKNSLKKLPKIYGVSPEDKRKLEIIFNLSQASVSNYLNGKRNNKDAKQVRHVALTQMGGFEAVTKF